MRKFPLALSAALGLALSLPATAQEVANTNLKLTCNVSGLYPDGARIQGAGAEEISIDIRRVNRNEKEPAKAPAWTATSDIRVTSNGRTRTASLLKSTPDQVAFGLASDAVVDGVAQTLALTYEIRLDRLQLKRTVMTLFSPQGSNIQSAEGNCVRTGGGAATTAPAAAAAGPTPAWLVELRRKLKECSGKDMFSQSSCVERMQERYCANRPIKVPECETK